MSQKVREEMLPRMRQRYGGRGKEGRGRLLDEVCEQFGYSRKHAIKLPGLSVFCEHRFVVVVGEGIVEPGFDDRLVWFGWVAGSIDPHAGFPQSEVAQDAFDHCGLVDEGHDAHFVLALRAEQRVGFPDFLDEFAPLF